MHIILLNNPNHLNIQQWAYDPSLKLQQWIPRNIKPLLLHKRMFRLRLCLSRTIRFGFLGLLFVWEFMTTIFIEKMFTALHRPTSKHVILQETKGRFQSLSSLFVLIQVLPVKYLRSFWVTYTGCKRMMHRKFKVVVNYYHMPGLLW